MSFPPTFKQLRYLVALHKTLHFGRAAEDCHVTQSTLSAGIQELETLLGLNLVERTKRTVMFTPDGQEVVRRAQTILAEVEDLTTMAAAAREPGAGLVRMGVIPTIAPFLLPDIMPKIRQEMPRLELHLREDKSATLCAKLKDGDLDVILYALPFHCGDVVEAALFEDPFFAAYPKGRGPKIGIQSQDLEQEQLMLLEEGHCLRDHALSACNLVGKPAKDALSGTSLHTIMEMVSSGFGVTLLPGMAIRAGLVNEDSVDIVSFTDIQPMRTIGLVWRPSNPRSETFQCLANLIRSVARANRPWFPDPSPDRAKSVA